ncbi:hypothetical protein OCH239_15205 [Roseivivax halodurans JCM 10272]|uniref:CHRD domain-containing protein n=1 Tax=Roseivivax halodurans JCM 10272 TaxID=1449350 RepID=X7EAQ8_9RHOB|nr:calcium-binding protein [Roseivivax halodurans]ETX12925.1 hypothetical protein OCH239_15205 [Roseivivax halodurans JCM 10272]
MAHLASSYESYETFLNGADAIWTVDLGALNSSGVSGTAIVATSTDEDGSSYLNVAISGTGLTPDQVHAQHVHGRFDASGNPIDSVSPTLADDADLDGMVEVLEGVGKYGDVLLPLVSPEGGDMPMADRNGTVSFLQSYDLDDAANFFSPVTGTDYTADDIMPLALREIVLHGVQVPDGLGEGTDGEVDGGTNGYTGILPAAAGEIESATLDEALAILGEQRATASAKFVLGGGRDVIDTGVGDDTVFAGSGDDEIAGGSDNDMLFGVGGDDLLYGNAGDDTIFGGLGEDTIYGGDGDDDLRGRQNDDVMYGVGGDDIMQGNGGDDVMLGGGGNDTMFGGSGDDAMEGRIGDDKLFGVDGDDKLQGNDGDDVVFGGSGNDTAFGGSGDDLMRGGDGDDKIYGVDGNDDIAGGTGNDTLAGGSGDDTVLGEDGDDQINGLSGNDLLVGGNGADMILGGTGLDIIGGGAGDDTISGGAGADEFHFDAGTGSDIILDFTQGDDVISFLDDGAIAFANSSENDTRGDSDLAAADFDTISTVADIDTGNDQQVIFSTGGLDDAMAASGADVEAYLAVNDGEDSYIYYDEDWSDTAGRELVATLEDVSTALTVSDFDVY